MTIRQILVNVWQRHISPKEALEEIERDNHTRGISKEELLELLQSVANRKMNVAAFLHALHQKNATQN